MDAVSKSCIYDDSLPCKIDMNSALIFGSLKPLALCFDTIIAAESVPGDDIHERAVNIATTVYLLEGDKPEVAQYVPIHECTAKMVSVGLLQTKSVRS